MDTEETRNLQGSSIYDELFGPFRPQRPGTTGVSEPPQTAREVSAHVARVVSGWCSEYNSQSKSESVVKLFNFAVTSSGCPGTIPLSTDLEATDAAEEIAQLQQQFDLDAGAEYPLVARNVRPNDYFQDYDNALAQGKPTAIITFMSGQRFKKILVEFWTQWVKSIYAEDILFADSQPGATAVLTWMIHMSSSHFRPFRHTATVSVLAATSALCDIGNKLWKRWTTLNRQMETEVAAARKRGDSNAKSAKLTRIETEIEELNYSREVIEELLSDVMGMVFTLRYHDSDSGIRQECITELAQWIVKHPSTFMDNKYVRHLGWTLSDKTGMVRLASLKSLRKLYEVDSFVDKLREFTLRFSARVVEMALADKDSHVRLEATGLLCEILFAKGLLQDTDRNRLSLLMFHNDSKVRELAVPLVVERIDDAFELMASENGFVDLIQDGADMGNKEYEIANAWYIRALSSVMLEMAKEKQTLETTESQNLSQDLDSLAVMPLGTLNELKRSDFLASVNNKIVNESMLSWAGLNVSSATNNENETGEPREDVPTAITMESVEAFMRPIYNNLRYKFTCEELISILTNDNPLNSTMSDMMDTPSSTQSMDHDDDIEDEMEDEESTPLRGKRRSSRLKPTQKSKKQKGKSSTLGQNRKLDFKLNGQEETCMVYILRALVALGADSGKSSVAITAESLRLLPNLLSKYVTDSTILGTKNLLSMIVAVGLVNINLYFRNRMYESLSEIRDIVISKIFSMRNETDVLSAASSLVRQWSPQDATNPEDDAMVIEGADTFIFSGEITIFRDETSEKVSTLVIDYLTGVRGYLDQIDETLIDPSDDKQLDEDSYVEKVHDLFNGLMFRLHRLERLFSRCTPIGSFSVGSIVAAAKSLEQQSQGINPTTETEYELFTTLFNTVFRVINFSVNVLSDFEANFKDILAEKSTKAAKIVARVQDGSIVVQQSIASSIKLACQLGIWETCSLIEIKDQIEKNYTGGDHDIDEDSVMIKKSFEKVNNEVATHMRQLEKLSTALFTTSELQIALGLKVSSVSIFCTVRNLDVSSTPIFDSKVRSATLKSAALAIDEMVRYVISKDVTRLKDGESNLQIHETLKIASCKIIIDFLRILTVNTENWNAEQSTDLSESIGLLWCLCPYVSMEQPLLDNMGLFRMLKVLLPKMNLQNVTPENFNTFALNCFLPDYKNTIKELRHQGVDVNETLKFGETNNEILDSNIDIELKNKLTSRRDFLFLSSTIGISSKDRLAQVFRFLRYWFLGLIKDTDASTQPTATADSDKDQEEIRPSSVPCLQLTRNMKSSKNLKSHKKMRDMMDPDYIDDDEYNDVAVNAKEKLATSQQPFNLWMQTLLTRHKLGEKMISPLERLLIDSKTNLQKDRMLHRKSEESLQIDEVKIDLMDVFLNELRLSVGR